MLALYIIASIFMYIFMSTAIGTRHHSLSSRKCNYNNCFKGEWCGHVYASIWLYGVFWPFMIPAALGVMVGKTDGISYSERKRAREIDAAKHRQELARINAETIRIQEIEAGISR